MGRRIRKVVTSLDNSQVIDEIRFVYDGWNLIAQLNANLTPRRTFVWGLDLSGTILGAGGVGGLLMFYDHTVWTSHFAGYDGNGNVAILTHSGYGTLSAVYEYGPFGEPIRVSGTMGKMNPFRFSTKYSDDESDLLYYGYRYYSQSTGRWLNRDPVEEKDGPSLYSIVQNSCINNVDFLGLKTIKVSKCTVLVIYGHNWAGTTKPGVNNITSITGADGCAYASVIACFSKNTVPNSIPLPGYTPPADGVDSNINPNDEDASPTSLPQEFAKVKAAFLKTAATMCNDCCCKKIRLEVQHEGTFGEWAKWPTMKEGTYNCKNGKFEEDLM